MSVGEATIKEPLIRASGESAAPKLREHPEKAGGAAGEVARILGISVPISVTLAEKDFRLEALTAVTVGTILEFDVPSNAELTLHAANQPIGKGMAVKVGENFGLRVTRIGTVRERIGAFHQ